MDTLKEVGRQAAERQSTQEMDHWLHGVADAVTLAVLGEVERQGRSLQTELTDGEEPAQAVKYSACRICGRGPQT